MDEPAYPTEWDRVQGEVPPITPALVQAAMRRLNADADRIEAACKLARDLGCGVLVHRNERRDLLTAEPHDVVPKGQLWELVDPPEDWLEQYRRAGYKFSGWTR